MRKILYLLLCFSLFACGSKQGDTSWANDDYGEYPTEEDIPNLYYETPPPEEPKEEIIEPDAERIKWDLQGQTFTNPVSGRYLRQITILRKEDITDLKIVSKNKDDDKDFVNFSVTATIKSEGYSTYIADLDIAYNVREITGGKVTKGWVYYWTKVKKIDVVTAKNNYRSCLESRLIDGILTFTNTCTNAIVVEGAITRYNHPQNFYLTLEAGGTDYLTEIKDYKIEKVFRP